RMPLRHPSFVAGFVLLAAAAGAEETGARKEGAARTALREHIRAKLPAFAPTAPPPAAASPILNVAADPTAPPADLITLAPVVVFKPRELSKPELIAARQKEASFESHALYSKELTKKVRFEALLLPEPGRQGGLTLPVFRLSW
ncbi:MAG: hypothetical protein NTV51_10730, partial [Verrucomicrobia bacterium]|nr:hypothetical protein [Verrucomicrobiota bacterium]